MIRINRQVVSVIAGLLLLIAAACAHAHPYGPEYYSFRSVVEVQQQTLRVTVAVEAPTPKVLKQFAAKYSHLEDIGEREDREFFQSQLDSIASGLTVTLDGEPLAVTWKPADSPINGRADARFFYYFVTFEAEGVLPGAACELVIANRAFVAEQAYYSGWIRPLAGWTVSDSNLHALGTAAQAEDVSEVKEAWSDDVSLRDLRVRLAPEEDGS